ncbi:hypothetical protein [Mesorhizobium dulcispinae]|uniref:hypothetical protein n=1 Tax=Mesorhizobium dulcispinae TaxID=3072316 RepID=UPI002A23E3A7|nr:hypothetical protein [Mesorhizobium sp. VK23D]MDX8521838.1 hypothetical protein [Mesorhizobium sp. VK23D]
MATRFAKPKKALRAVLTGLRPSYASCPKGGFVDQVSAIWVRSPLYEKGAAENFSIHSFLPIFQIANLRERRRIDAATTAQCVVDPA